jgi:lysophospholipase L1-like esterase
MTDLLLYTDRIVLRYKPRLIVVNEGGNDIHSGRKPEQLLADIQTFVSRVREALPDVPIAFSGLTPSPARWSETDTRLRFNQMLKGYLATGKNLIYLDLFDSYLGADGKPRDELFVEDKLHHSAAGYALRIQIMRPFLGAPDFQERKPSR